MGVYVIGLNAFYPNDIDNSTLILKIKGTSIKNNYSNQQRIYSNKFIGENYGKFKELNENDVFIDFLRASETNGNIIPIWPGGNMLKGMSQCYDLPDIFLNKDSIKDFASKYYCVKSDFVTNSFMEGIFNSKYTDLETILNFNKDKYEEFLKDIIKIIDDRSEELKKIL